MSSVNGKVAFITGGASGIGLGIARALGAAGARIALADIEAGALARAREDLRGAGIDAWTTVLDVSDREAFASARDRAVAALGGVQLLFNNAGVNAAGPIGQMTYADWDWVLGVNLHGVINGVMTFLPELTRHGNAAHVVNTASVGGLVGMRNLAIYNTTKFGVVGLSEALRADLAASGVAVSVLCPGIVATALGTSERNRPGRAQPPGSASAAAASGIAQPTPDAPAPAPGMSTQELGQIVLEAMQDRRFFISSHPEFRDIVGQRNAAVQASFQGTADPAAVTAMHALVLPF
ncbi:MAG: SDR family NAD(P)-dependent oxidoreductase [Pseudomonadales bacterium]